ncbi:MAG: hypothetical protein AB1Z98_26860 [Nannocystaceae bacterium]
MSMSTGLLAAGGCPQGPPVQSALELRAPVPDEPTPRAPDSQPEPSALARQMHEQLALVTAIQQATVRGDLPEAQTHAQALTEQLRATIDDADAPESWRPHLNAIDGELEALQHADDLRAAGSTVARLGLGCGRCHQAQAVTPALPELTPPESGEGLEAAMRTHRWATDRMWEGLVGPSSDRWIRGSTMFIVLPGCDETMGAAGPEQRAQCQHAQSLARRGHVARSLEARATIYGRLLTTCAQCHAAAKAG